LQIVSNGLFRSVEHRAVIHPTRERISVALFHYPYQDRMLCPLPELVKKGGGARYGPTSYRDFLTQYFTAQLDGRKHLERLKLDC
jgi:isopenicillin N synthase-like dioxygenase